MTDDQMLSDLLLRWEEAWEHGEELSPESLCADRPELRQPLLDRIAALKDMAWMTSADNSSQQTLDPSIPEVLVNRYRIEELIGEGGFGRVYRAFDEELQRKVAVKVAQRPASDNDGLFHEARRVAQLRQPGIVAVHDVGQDGGMTFIVSDLIEGSNLADQMEQHRYSTSEVVRLLMSIAESLHHAHEQGFVHRDIKPANILLDEQGRPLLTDLGIAATVEELPNKAVSSGTLPYMAPEQVAGEVQLIDHRTDIYALGVVMYEMLTGQVPFQARIPTALREQILFRPPPPLRSINASIPESVEKVCLRCLAKHPADRYATASELAHAFSQSLTEHHKSRMVTFVWSVGIVLLLAGLALAGSVYVPALFHQTQTDMSNDSADAPPVIEGAVYFDGQTSIDTGVTRLAPVTLEVWVRPTEHKLKTCQFIIGSDIVTEYGMGLALCEAIIGAEYVQGMFYSQQVVPLNEWSHIAAVFGETETRLYFNGTLVKTGPPTDSDASTTNDTTFVIGNVGKGNPINHFTGYIRDVRISQGERFTADFTPDSAFSADTDRTVFVFDH
ncbi:MAG: protein kinase [Planctomycetaceae bacterium]|nr:protein kinase [Planctomycetaceae bacterium]